MTYEAFAFQCPSTKPPTPAKVRNWPSSAIPAMWSTSFGPTMAASRLPSAMTTGMWSGVLTACFPSHSAYWTQGNTSFKVYWIFKSLNMSFGNFILWLRISINYFNTSQSIKHLKYVKITQLCLLMNAYFSHFPDVPTSRAAACWQPRACSGIPVPVPTSIWRHTTSA